MSFVQSFFGRLDELDSKSESRAYERIHINSRYHVNFALHAAIDNLLEEERTVNQIGTVCTFWSLSLLFGIGDDFLSVFREQRCLCPLPRLFICRFLVQFAPTPIPLTFKLRTPLRYRRSDIYYF